MSFSVGESRELTTSTQDISRFDYVTNAMSAVPLDADDDDKMQEASYDSYDSIVASSIASMSQSQSFDHRSLSSTANKIAGADDGHPSSWQPRSGLEDSMLSVNTTNTAGSSMFSFRELYAQLTLTS